MDKQGSPREERRKNVQSKKPLSHLNQSSSSPEFQIMHYHQPIGSNQMDELFSSRDRLRDFADKIGHTKFSGIRKDVLNHCSKTKFANGNTLTFENVEKMVKNRIQKMIKNKRIKKNWSEEDVKILIWVVSKYSQFRDILNIQKQMDPEDWKFIASLIPGVQGEHCMFKWLSLRKNNLSENNWSEKQSNLLDKIVKKLGDSDWSIISQQLYYSNNSVNKTYRCPKQCRQHWNCYLNPKLKKGPWSKNQDLLLLNCVKENNGSKKWAEMIGLFNGRTENALKNRFTLIMEKESKICDNLEVSELDLINQYLQRTFVQQFVCRNEEKQKQKEGEIEKQKQQDKKEVRFSLRRRQNLRSSNGNKKINKSLFHEQSQLKSTRKKVKSQSESPLPKKEDISLEEEEEGQQQQQAQQQQASQHENSDFMLRDDISEPQNFWMESDHKIFEDESFSSSGIVRFEEELPELEKVKIIQLSQDEVEHLKMSMLQNSNDYVPCIIAENKITKILY